MLTFGGVGAEGAMLAALTRTVTRFDQLAIAASYVQLSGWRLLEPLLGGKARQVRLVCTDQLAITDSAAVRAMPSAGVDVRAWAGTAVFHPKLFLASNQGATDRLLLGSANLSRSALMTGVEAGYEVRDEGAALRWFDELWNDPARVEDFDEARLARLDDAFGRRLARELRTAQQQPEQAPSSRSKPPKPLWRHFRRSSFRSMPIRPATMFGRCG